MFLIEEERLGQNGGLKAWKLPAGLGHCNIIHTDHYKHTMGQSWVLLAPKGGEQNPMRQLPFCFSIECVHASNVPMSVLIVES